MELSDNLLKLSELFPDISLVHLSHILKTTNNNFDDCVEQLLNYDLIKDDLDDIITRSQKKEQDNDKNCMDSESFKRWVLLDSKSECLIPASNGKPKQKDRCDKDLLDSNGSSMRTDMSNVTKDSSNSITTNGSNIATKYETLDSLVESVKSQDRIEKITVEEKIMELLAIPAKYEKHIEWYLKQNEYKLLETIYDILLNYNATLPVTKQTRKKIESISMDTIIINYTQECDNTSMSDNLKDDGSDTLLDQYFSHLSLITDSSSNFNVPEKFFVLGLTWFMNDFDKVLNLSLELQDYFPEKRKKKEAHIDFSDFENAYETENVYNKTSTIPLNNPIDSHGFFKIDKYGKFDKSGFSSAYGALSNNSSLSVKELESHAKNYKKSRDSSSNKNLQAFYGHKISDTRQRIRDYQENEQLQLRNKKISFARKTWEIDLHDLSVQNAIDALEIVVNEWWETEMFHRNIENTKFELSTASHIKPLTVVTGRGLHSGGNIPKIKNAALKFLRNSSYKFIENTSTITIVGKRRRK